MYEISLYTKNPYKWYVWGIFFYIWPHLTSKVITGHPYLWDSTLKHYFESQLIYKWHYYRQTIFNQLNIMVSYVDIIGLSYHGVAILW